MSELELRLNRLGQALDVPDAPDLTGAVRQRLAEGRRPRREWRRPALIAVAAVLVVVGALMAVPQSRSAILDFFGIGSVTIRTVDEYPQITLPSDGRFHGDRVTLAEARRRAPFPIRVPQVEGLGQPKIYYLDDVHQVTFIYGDPDRPRLLVAEIIGTGAVEKLINIKETDVEMVRDGDAFGVWLEGTHLLHFPQFDESFTVVGNTLIMQRTDNVTTRVEAEIPKAEALRIFRSMD
jgi:hypothetical protein